MTAPPGKQRERQYKQALHRRSRTHPNTFGPFTVFEYARSDWQALDWCTRWPTAPASNPSGPVRPPGGVYPDVPVLVLSGELDSITTPAEGRMVRDQFPSAQFVLVRNSFHVTAIGDTDDCAVRILRAFVRAPGDPAGRPAAAVRRRGGADPDAGQLRPDASRTSPPRPARHPSARAAPRRPPPARSRT